MKILIHTDSPLLYSGLARCGKELAKRFYEKTHIDEETKQEVKTYDIAYAGWHYCNTSHTLPYFLYPLDKSSSKENDQFKHILEDARPDIILSIGDIWNFTTIEDAIRSYKEINQTAKWVLWLTVDGEHLHPSWHSILNLADDINVFSYFAKQEIYKYSSIQTNVVYPGVDKNIFFTTTPNVRENTLPIQLNNTFLVININQNTDRKNIPLTLEAFKNFAVDKDDVFLLLVTDPNDPFGFDLWDFVKLFDIRKKVAITREAGPLKGMSDQQLNLIYNLASVSVNTSIGEGLSLPTLEAMAVGIPVLTTNYAATTELIHQGGGILLKVAGYLYGFNGIKRALVSHEDLTEQLNILYNDFKTTKVIRNGISERSKIFTNNLTWDNTALALMRRFDHMATKKQFNFIREHIKIKDINPLLVIPSWGTHCGIAEYTKSLFDAIRLKGQHVVVYSSYEYDELPKIVQDGNYNIIHIQHEFSFFKDKQQLNKLLEQLRLLKVKIIVTMHSFVPGMISYNELILSQVDKVIVHCDVFKKKIIERFNDGNIAFTPETNNVEVISMGCGNLHSFEQQRILETKRNLNITQNSPIIGSFGFLRDQKGFQEYLLAVKVLRKQYPNILALLVCPKHEFGSKVYDETFFNFIERQDLQNNVLLIREYLPENKLLDVLQCADLFVLNYHDSPTGGGISAAVKTLFRVQRPIIVNDTLAFFDLKDEVFKINSINPDVLAKAIKDVLCNKELQQNLVASANHYIELNNWDNIAQRHLDLYTE